MDMADNRDQNWTTTLSRRHLLQLGALTFGSLMTSTVAQAREKPPQQLNRSLNLYNLHTKEHLDITYWQEGQYLPEALGQINHLMRDHRANESTHMDLDLLDLMFQISQRMKTRKPFHIVSAYRCPATNAQLRKRHKGVAKKSQHVYGKAVDFYLPGYRLSTHRRVALSCRKGGVGYYPKSHFIHIDTARVRSW